MILRKSIFGQLFRPNIPQWRWNVINFLIFADDFLGDKQFRLIEGVMQPGRVVSLSIRVLRAAEGGGGGGDDNDDDDDDGGPGAEGPERGKKGGFVRPSGINGRENECHLFRNTHPENHGSVGEKFTEKATAQKVISRLSVVQLERILARNLEEAYHYSVNHYKKTKQN
ncbi:hypothetical protein EAI_15348 [Harpegnathos saltator]|uniref:Uncharacterized protein n=1 Tax=Harpegnathos saltator TaxID=610380 RepID=E2BDF1_HARSA|nr:hypothetical protein EAI_15348 [Harpegnathos saltator]